MGQVKITFRSNSTFTVPSGVTSITVECEGGGGAGGAGGALLRGGGGGGGAYASSVLSVTPGSAHSVVVGAQVPGSTDGNLSSFGTGPLVRAAGGKKGVDQSGLSAGAGGAGGAVADSIGTTRTAGTAGTNGGPGGAGAPPLGGAGGPNPGGNPGSPPGGGGSGGAALSGAGGAGAQGVVIVTFDYASESVAATDTVSVVVDWNRNIDDAVTPIDNFIKNITKPVDDSSIAIDTIAKLTSQTRADTVSSLDAVSKVLSKSVPDSITTADSALIVLVYLRNLTDTANAVDVISKRMSLSTADAAAVVDSVSKLVKKNFSDSMTVSDQAVVRASYNRIFIDSVVATDVLAKRMGLRVDDNISGSAPPPSTGGRRIFIISD